MFMSQEGQKFFVLKQKKVVKGIGNYLQNIGKQFCKICKTLRNMRCYSFKIGCIINTIAVFRTQSHI